MMKIHRIVITGGPCDNKTKIFDKIKEKLSEMGCKVFVVSESYSEMCIGGIEAQKYTNMDFQSMIFKYQMAKENVYNTAASKHSSQNVVILFDRGLFDPIACMAPEVASFMISLLGYSVEELLSRYEAVIHVRSNNKVMDDSLLRVWSTHPNLRTVGNESDIEKKTNKIIQEICEILGTIISD